jgi:hypothetical protein
MQVFESGDDRVRAVLVVHRMDEMREKNKVRLMN